MATLSESALASSVSCVASQLRASRVQATHNDSNFGQVVAL